MCSAEAPRRVASVSAPAAALPPEWKRQPVRWPRLDVRGKRYIEAEPQVDQWIDEAILAGNSPLAADSRQRYGHARARPQEFLRAPGHVNNVRYGDENEGGGGVTVFELR